MHGPVRRYALACTAAVGLFAVAGCGSEAEPTKAVTGQEVLLQSVVAAGPDPFTASTATSLAALPPPAHQGTGQQGRPGPGAAGSGPAAALRAVTGSTPGLYGGTHKRGSCDVEQQVRFYAADRNRARAFAAAAGVESARIAEFLRGLTPVVLRADTRVTSHGFRGGRAAAYQAVLQAGTAVLVDDYGLPRVRCACGNPLMPPVEGGGSSNTGTPWPGFQPAQVVVIKPTDAIVDNLVIVNISNNTWIERRSGDDGAQDKVPAEPPPFDPSGPVPSGPAADAAPAVPHDPCTGSGNSLARTAPPQSGGRAPAGSGDRPAPCTSASTRPALPDVPTAPGDRDRPADVPGDSSSRSDGLSSDELADGFSDGFSDGLSDDFSDGSRSDGLLPDESDLPAWPDEPVAPDPLDDRLDRLPPVHPEDLYDLPDGGVSGDPATDRGSQLESA
ncbi:DUF6777 domain-containing protein [Streptomyces sp. NPDC002073]